MTEDIDKLLARADAAIAEAKRLTRENEDQQQRAVVHLQLMFSSFLQFMASGRATHHPEEFQEQRPPYQPDPPKTSDGSRAKALGARRGSGGVASARRFKALNSQIIRDLARRRLSCHLLVLVCGRCCPFIILAHVGNEGESGAVRPNGRSDA